MSAAAKPTIVLQGEGVRIPANFTDLESFRQWVRSDEFPERGRIDWIDGEVQIDMSPENLNTHATLKTAFVRTLGDLVEDSNLGIVCTDSTRVSSPAAGLSVEPDVVAVFATSVESGRVRLVPSARGGKGSYVEIEGPPDIVVEVVSDSDPKKDWEELREGYWKAGVEEYWVADARKEPLRFVIFRRGASGYEEAPADAEGFIPSSRLGTTLRLVALPPLAGVMVRYRLEHRP